jgi:hypothetical protein
MNYSKPSESTRVVLDAQPKLKKKQYNLIFILQIIKKTRLIVQYRKHWNQPFKITTYNFTT